MGFIELISKQISLVAIYCNDKKKNNNNNVNRL